MRLNSCSHRPLIKGRLRAIAGAFLGLGLAVALLGGIAGGVTLVAAETPREEVTLEEILRRVERNSSQPAGDYGFRQDITLSWLLFSWYFYSEVVSREEGLTVRTFNAPRFVPEEISNALIDVTGHLDRFQLELEGTTVGDDGVVRYVIAGERRPEYATGAEGGRIWVREDTWLITRMEIRYPWGRLDIEQDHQIIEGYAFPRRQVVRVSPLDASMTVDYKEFWFAE